MRFRVLVAMAIGLLCGAESPPPGGGAGALAQLRGEWQLLSTADAKRTDPGSEQIRMVIGENGRVVFKFRGLATNRGVLQIRPADRARHLDLKLANGTTVLGVYDLFGDDLVICCDEAGKGRPAGLEPTGTQWVERWRRSKP